MILVNNLFPVMKEDSELSSHPIIVEVSNPSQITSVFDSISYSKVGAMHMFSTSSTKSYIKSFNEMFNPHRLVRC